MEPILVTGAAVASWNANPTNRITYIDIDFPQRRHKWRRAMGEGRGGTRRAYIVGLQGI